MSVGDRIRLLRNEKKISIRKLAEITGLSKSTLSEIENNISKNPTIDTLDKISKALGVSVAELLDISGSSSAGSEDGAETNLSRSKSVTIRIDCGDDKRKEKFLRSVARAKDRQVETLDKIADFIDFILDQEDKKVNMSQ